MNNVLQFVPNNELIDKVEDYRQINRNIKQLTKRLNELKKQIVEMHGKGDIFDNDGVLVAEVYSTMRTVFDSKRFEEENEVLAQDYKKQVETSLSLRLK